MIVLDTNVISELMATEPDDGVLEWTAGKPPTSLFTTTVTEAEILFGIRLLPKGKRRDLIEAAAAALFDRLFGGRVLPFGRDAASAYARILADRRRRGSPMSTLDAQIAGVARAMSAELATRNTADFGGCGIHLIDPWKEPRP
jgi:hypothetical protein